MALRVNIEKTDTGEQVWFDGDINEDAEVTLIDLKSQLGPNCVFNLKNVSSVNSCGVRAWINFIRDVDKDREITLEECTPEIVSQINMIPNFKGASKIHSVYSSYICESCDTQKLVLFEEGKNLPKTSEESVEPVSCPNCSEEMEMEEIESEFFGWLDD